MLDFSVYILRTPHSTKILYSVHRLATWRDEQKTDEWVYNPNNKSPCRWPRGECSWNIYFCTWGLSLLYTCCSFPLRHCGNPPPSGDESVTEWILWGHLRKCDRKRWWIIIYCSFWIRRLKGVPAETSRFIRPVNRTPYSWRVFLPESQSLLRLKEPNHCKKKRWYWSNTRWEFGGGFWSSRISRRILCAFCLS